MTCTCSTPITGNSHGLCPACVATEQAVIDRLHALKNNTLVHAGQIALADDPDEVMEHVIALQDISNEMALYGGERADVRDIIRDGKGWARGPVQMNCLKLGIIEERRLAA